FQAEDGIRDFHVTGVQTCALPISKPLWLPCTRSLPKGRSAPPFFTAVASVVVTPSELRAHPSGIGFPFLAATSSFPFAAADVAKIGRASCRETMWLSLVPRWRELQ